MKNTSVISTDPPIPAVVLGASGYVAGELLRLLALHPRFNVVAAVSQSQAGHRADALFPHLRGCIGDLTTVDEASALDRAQSSLQGGAALAVFSATPHGETAEVVRRWAAFAERSAMTMRWVDLSADF